MSGSDKYSSVRIEEARRAKLAAERARKALEEEMQRRVATERARAVHVKGLQSAYATQFAEVSRRFDEQTSNLLPADRDRLQADLQAVRAAGMLISDDSSWQSVDERLRRLASCLAEAQNRFVAAENERLETLARGNAEHVRLKGQIASLSVEEREKFDRAGIATVDQSIRHLASSLSDAGAIMESVRRAEVAYREHVSAIDKAKNAWLKRLQAASAEIAQAEALIQGLVSDEVVMIWHSTRVNALQERIMNLNALLAAEEFSAVHVESSNIRKLAENYVAEAQEKQLLADQRDYVVASLTNALKQTGFDIAEVVDVDAGHPLSSKTIRAVTNAGKGMALTVPADGNVTYRVSGFERRTVTGHGEVGQTCDEAVSVIERVRQVAKSLFEIEIGDVLWEGKPKFVDKMQKDFEVREAKSKSK